MPMPRIQKRRRRQRSTATMPRTIKASIIASIVVLSILTKDSHSWISPIVGSKMQKTGKQSFGEQQRSFPFQSTGDSLDSVDQIFPQFAPPPSSMASQSAISPLPTQAIYDIVIVLNTNAKGVTEDLIDTARDAVKQQNIAQQESDMTCRTASVRLLVTSTYEEAKSASREIIAEANAAGTTTLVIPVGGDGTLTTMINLLWEEHRSNYLIPQPHTINGYSADQSEKIKSRAKFPIVFGYVAMGTGNGLGSCVGNQPITPNQNYRRKRRKLLKLIHRCLRPQATKRKAFRRVLSQMIKAVAQTNTIASDHNPIEVDVVDLPLIRIRTIQGETNESGIETKKDQYAFFAGLGYDSLLLQDYKDMQDWTATKTKSGGHRLWQLATTGVVGYTVAMFTRSLPKLLKLEDATRLLREVKITTNEPRATYWIDHRRGDIMRPIVSTSHHAWEKKEVDVADESTLVYHGSAGIIATGTVPYYDGGLRLFPFARMTPSGMHLRVAREFHPLEGVVRIPSIFEGSYRDKKPNTFQCLDFIGNQFSIEIYESYKYDGKESVANHETEEGFPVQHSGETMGRCTHVEFTIPSSDAEEVQYPDFNATFYESEHFDDIMPPPMRFLTLMPPRTVEE